MRRSTSHHRHDRFEAVVRLVRIPGYDRRPVFPHPLHDDGFTPRLFTIDGGEEQRFVLTLVNAGSESHQMAIDDLNVRSGVIPPGQRGTLDFVPAREGTYRFVDPLPGHEQAGLVGFVTID
jgi:uncharacterized cupredoxin-like copper-binding protein